MGAARSPNIVIIRAQPGLDFPTKTLTRTLNPDPNPGCRPQRLVTYSEEVAFNDPPAGGAERLILNQHLRRLLAHSKLSAFQRFVQGVTLRLTTHR